MSVIEPPIPKHTLEALELYVETVVAALLKPSKTTPLTLTNRSIWPPKSGVYAIYQGSNIVWVGESGDLSARAKDLFRTKNHSFRRLLGAKVFSRRMGFEPATKKKSFSPEIELNLTKYMERRLSFAVAPVAAGRKEIEERACAATKGLLNIRKQRGARGE